MDQLIVTIIASAITAILTTSTALVIARKNYEFEFRKRRTAKVQDILEGVWKRVQTLRQKIGVFTAFFREYPDLKAMQDESIRETLLRNEFHESEIEYILNSSDRQAAYIPVQHHHELISAYQALHSLREWVNEHRICLETGLIALLEELITTANRLLIAQDERNLARRELARGGSITENREYSLTLRNEVQEASKLLEGLNDTIQEKIRVLLAKP